ncbi:MAG: GNAT family N-acetyltransferase [Nanoarchaeota archaeon]|nr:GNAT family N-acetyltransferase [Nanoarchaeota archaeon]
MTLNIREIKLEDIQKAVNISFGIPEFETPNLVQDYIERIGDKDHLILIGEKDNIPAGFKIGYNKNNDGSFYSWMGGVLPQYRRQGIANQLAEYQEDWAKRKLYTSIQIKTRQKFQGMLYLAIKRGYQMTSFDDDTRFEDKLITLEKRL